MRKKRGRKMRLENKFGTICQLSGNRRKPFMARSGPTGETDTGIPTRKIIGYYETWEDAYRALLEYNHNPYEMDAAKLTYADVYKLLTEKEDKAPGGRSKATINVETSAYKATKCLENHLITQIKTSQLQRVMDDLTEKYSLSSLRLVKSLWSKMWKYCEQNDIVDKNYASYVEFNTEDDREHCQALTEEELDFLWSHSDELYVQLCIVMCYAGFRASAYKTLKVDLDKKVFIGGVKTKASKERTVPIHSRIIPLVENLLNKETLFGDQYYTIMRRVDSVKTKYNFPHTAHDFRATLATRLDAAGVDPYMIKRIMGHVITDITQGVYVQKTVEELRAELEKIK